MLGGSTGALYLLLYFIQHSLYSVFGWFRQQSAIEFADVEAEEVKAVIYMSYQRFLFGQGKPPFRKKRCNQWLDFVFQQLLWFARDNEIICKPDKPYTLVN